MKWDVRVSRTAERDLAGLPANAARRAEKAFLELAEDPLRPRPGADILKMKGGLSAYRLRIGQYRILYVVEAPRVTITGIRHRSEAYGC